MPRANGRIIGTHSCWEPVGGETTVRIEYLEEFAALARFLSFTETASKLNMSQPTLSKHINSLERELKVPLFSRNGASLSLTKAGKLVLPYAFDIIESRKQMTIAAKQGASMLTPHLTIGGNVGLKTVLERINLMAAKFTAQYGVDIIEISDIEANPHASIDMASDTAPDFLFLYVDETDEMEQDTEVRLIARVPLSIVVNKKHRLASRESVTMDDLKSETFIKLEGNFVSGSWRFIEAACLSAGYSPSCQHVYFPRITDFLRVTFNLQHEILVLTNDYIKQYNAFISDNCIAVPINDRRAFMPLAVMYSMSNANPLIDEALEIILGNEKDDD